MYALNVYLFITIKLQAQGFTTVHYIGLTILCFKVLSNIGETEWYRISDDLHEILFGYDFPCTPHILHICITLSQHPESSL